MKVARRHEVEAMSERKERFTPGPWAINTGADEDNVYVYVEEIESPHGMVAWARNPWQEMVTTHPDAHLIAAAPELYYENKRAAKKLRDVKTFLEANPLTEWMTAHWDGTECDGNALLEEVKAQLADLERVAAKARGEA